MIGAVGFMNQQLDIPKDVNPQWASIIESCWHRFVSYSCRHYVWLIEANRLFKKIVIALFILEFCVLDKQYWHNIQTYRDVSS